MLDGRSSTERTPCLNEYTPAINERRISFYVKFTTDICLYLSRIEGPPPKRNAVGSTPIRQANCLLNLNT